MGFFNNIGCSKGDIIVEKFRSMIDPDTIKYTFRYGYTCFDLNQKTYIHKRIYKCIFQILYFKGVLSEKNVRDINNIFPYFGGSSAADVSWICMDDWFLSCVSKKWYFDCFGRKNQLTEKGATKTYEHLIKALHFFEIEYKKTGSFKAHNLKIELV